MREQIGIAIVTDKTFLPHAATAAHSLLSSNPGQFRRVFFVSPDLVGHNFSTVRDFLERRHQAQVELVRVSRQKYQHMYSGNKYGSIVWLKLFAPDSLPLDLNYCLLLDADTVVLRPLKALVDIANAGFSGGGVVWAVQEGDGSNLRQHGFLSDRYFNSGVLFFNLEAWRKNSFLEKMLSIEKSTRRGRKWVDQDVMNLCFEGQWEGLPRSYNFGPRNVPDVAPPHIAHFSSPTKPWMWGCSHPNSKDYDFWRKQIPLRRGFKTGFFAFLVRSAFDWRFRKAVRRVLRRLRKALAAAGRRVGF